MPILSFQGLSINVPDLHRSKVYLKDLETLYQSIQDKLKKPKYQLTQAFFHADQTIPNAAVKSLLENIAQQYDGILMEHISADMKFYLRDQAITLFGKISGEQINYYVNDQKGQLSLVQARIQKRFAKEPKQVITAKITDRELIKAEFVTLYKEYFTSVDSSGKEFMQRLLHMQPEMIMRISKLTQNHVKNMSVFIKRITKDMPMIKRAFLEDLQNPQLIKIISSGSDFHKQGQQVMILVFKDNNQIRKVIYKPSPVVADAMLFGNINVLQTIDSKFKGERSFIELINKHLQQESPDTKSLPSYLIVPRQDKEANGLEGAYGYIEFLTHDPVAKIEPSEIAQEILQQYPLLTPAAIKQAEAKINAAIEKQHSEYVQQAALATSDFITHSKEDVINFSYQCGLLLGLMTITGISDSHLENLIVHNLSPMLIDGEVCFCVQVTPTPEDSSAFNLRTGSMNGAATTYEVLSIMQDITGKRNIQITTRGKNTLYYVNPQGDITIQQPVPEPVESGFKDCLTLMCGKAKEDVLAWFAQDSVKNMHVRLIPQSTSVFQGEMQDLQQHHYSYEYYEKYCIRKLGKGIQDYHEAITTYNQRISNDLNTTNSTTAADQEISSHYDKIIRQLPPLPVPNAAIFANNDQRTNIYAEYKNNSIPVYYLKANDKQLYDYNGLPIMIPPGYSMLREKINQSQMAPLSELLTKSEQTYKEIKQDEDGNKYREEIARLPDISNTEDTNFLHQSPLQTMIERFKKIATSSLMQEEITCVVKEQVLNLSSPELTQLTPGLQI